MRTIIIALVSAAVPTAATTIYHRRKLNKVSDELDVQMRASSEARVDAAEAKEAAEKAAAEAAEAREEAEKLNRRALDAEARLDAQIASNEAVRAELKKARDIESFLKGIQESIGVVHSENVEAHKGFVTRVDILTQMVDKLLTMPKGDVEGRKALEAQIKGLSDSLALRAMRDEELAASSATLLAGVDAINSTLGLAPIPADPSEGFEAPVDEKPSSGRISSKDRRRGGKAEI